MKIKKYNKMEEKNGTTRLKTCLADSHKVKFISTPLPRNSISKNLPKRKNVSMCSQRDVCVNVDTFYITVKTQDKKFTEDLCILQYEMKLNFKKEYNKKNKDKFSI